MSKQRMVNTKFWSDNWVREKLNALDRYLFLYFLTNEHTNICGIYELPLSLLAFESGIDKEDLIKTMLPKLEPKIYYVDGWVIIPNFVKNQNQQSPLVIKGIERELAEIPPQTLEAIHTLSIPYGYPIPLNLTKLNLTKPNLTGKEEDIKYQEINDEGEDVIKRKGMKRPVTVPPYPFNFNDELKRLNNSPVIDHRVVGKYLSFRGISYSTRESYDPALAREIKSAKGLRGYSLEEIDKGFNYCQNEWQDNWTLETVAKWLPQALKVKISKVRIYK